VSHVVVDEVHERSLQGDVLMALLQRIAAARNKAADEAAAAAAAGRGAQQQQQQHGQPQRLKVILMSATLDATIYRWGEKKEKGVTGRTRSYAATNPWEEGL
jgi:HrpA-like RNA helicase